MNPAPTTFTESGFSHEQRLRWKMIALYERQKGGARHWEVVILTPEIEKHFPATEKHPNGRSTPAHERYPGAEEWGHKGWTFNGKDNAEAKYEELIAEAEALPQQIENAGYRAWEHSRQPDPSEDEQKRLENVCRQLRGRYVTLVGEEIQ